MDDGTVSLFRRSPKNIDVTNATIFATTKSMYDRRSMRQRQDIRAARLRRAKGQNHIGRELRFACSAIRQRALTSSISSIVLQRASRRRGEQTRYARHWEREIATLRRLREKRKARLRGTLHHWTWPSRKRQ